MKKFIILLIFPLFGLWQASAQTQPATPATTTTPDKTAVNPNAPVAKWDKMVIDMGEIPKDIPKSAEFTLTNDGKEPLIIKNATAQCGCTTPKFSTEPILPGKSAIVTATYNAVNPGVFTKSVTVITNADVNPVVLQIKGTVK